MYLLDQNPDPLAGGDFENDRASLADVSLHREAFIFSRLHTCVQWQNVCLTKVAELKGKVRCEEKVRLDIYVARTRRS